MVAVLPPFERLECDIQREIAASKPTPLQSLGDAASVRPNGRIGMAVEYAAEFASREWCIRSHEYDGIIRCGHEMQDDSAVGNTRKARVGVIVAPSGKRYTTKNDLFRMQCEC